MNRRRFLQAAGIGLLAAGVPQMLRKSFAAGGGASNRPNIVLILVDDLGWADVGCYCAEYGNTYYETPNIDRLCNEGMKFTQGYAACAVCSPTRAATLTGRNPARIGITDWIRPSEATTNPQGYEGGSGNEVLCPKNYVFLDPGEVTIAEVLKPAGYATCHVGKWHLGGTQFYPPSQGFDENKGGCSWGHPFNGYFDPYGIATLPNRQTGEYLTDRGKDEAVGFIESAVGQTKPFFLYMAHYAVHTPIQAKDDIKSKYQAKAKPSGYDSLRADYAAMIESVDQSVGAILEKLEEMNVADNTLVIFTSDNGGLASVTTNKPLRSGKGFPYEGGIREPWLIRWPGQAAANSVCDEPIISMDILPTICDVTGLPLPAGREIDGLSFLPLIKQTGSLNRDSLFWHFPHYRSPEFPYSIIRSGHWKLIKRYAGNTEFELFNLKNDMSEKNDLAAARPDKVRELNEKLTIWLRHAKAKMPVSNPDYSGSKETKRVRLG